VFPYLEPAMSLARCTDDSAMITVIATIVSGVIGTAIILLGARFLLAPHAEEESSFVTGANLRIRSDRRKSDRNCRTQRPDSLFRRRS
jgi:hypothetical protein